jgi:hypothetical protein
MRQGGYNRRITSITNQSIKDAAEAGKVVAIQRAIRVGTVKESIFIAKIESRPIPYISNQLRIVSKGLEI